MSAAERVEEALKELALWEHSHGEDCPHRYCDTEPGEPCTVEECAADADAAPCAPKHCFGAAVVELCAASKALLKETEELPY